MNTQFRNTRETVGSTIEVTTSLKTSNGRQVQVKLTKQDLDLLEHIEHLMHASYGAVNSYTPSLKLKAEVLSDTFRGGLVGKLTNLKEVRQAWVTAHQKWVKEGGI